MAAKEQTDRRAADIVSDRLADIAALRQTAQAGNAQAQNDWGVLYYLGQDVPQDDVEAEKWFLLAEKQGFKFAVETRAHMRNALTPEQLREAQRRADAFIPRP